MNFETVSPIDWGPIYKETIYGRWPVEPWNTATTLFFFIFVAYWGWKIKDNWKDHLLIATCLPIIFVGFVGGFLYHSLRDNKWWLLLDWGPIMIIAIICCVYYWKHLLKSWIKSAAATFLPVLLAISLLKIFFPSGLLMSLGYPLLAIFVLTPLVLVFRKKTFHELRYLLRAVLCVISAITLRFLDRASIMDFLPMGSHFLWHTLGALTCHYFIRFNYENSLSYTKRPAP